MAARTMAYRLVWCRQCVCHVVKHVWLCGWLRREFREMNSARPDRMMWHGDAGDMVGTYLLTVPTIHENKMGINMSHYLHSPRLFSRACASAPGCRNRCVRAGTLPSCVFR